MTPTTALELAEMMRLAWSGPLRPVHVAFDGASPWLEHCRQQIESLPGLHREGSPDLVVTDGPSPEAWCFALDGRRLGPDLAGFFHHANRGPLPIELSLHSPAGEEASLRISPIPSFYWREQHASAMEAAPLLLTLAILRLAGCPLRAAQTKARLQPAAPAPNPLQLNWFRLKKVLRSLYLRLPGTNNTLHWKIALHPRAGDTIPTAGWQWFAGFTDHEEADPFLVNAGDRQWLFYEDMPPSDYRGRLAVAPAWESNGVPTVILEKPYHLSYPCVFAHDGHWWMIPESAANGTVDLYRARQFPTEWEHVKTLCQGPKLVDTTPYFHEGHWYFFTAAVLPGRAYLSLLFVADSLDAPWRLHPMSPLTGDSALARGAGPIRRWNGRLVRPVQDCLRAYGHSMTLMEIVELTPTTLTERPLRRIEADWQPGLQRTHTFCPEGEALVLDGRR